VTRRVIIYAKAYTRLFLLLPL